MKIIKLIIKLVTLTILPLCLVAYLNYTLLYEVDSSSTSLILMALITLFTVILTIAFGKVAITNYIHFKKVSGS